MTKLQTFEEKCMTKYMGQNALDLINRKLLIHKQLEKPPRNYVVYSDLHGSYKKFFHWLKNGLGFYKIAVQQTMGESYSKSISECYEQLLYVVNRTKFDAIEQYIESDEEVYDDKAHFFAPVCKEFCSVLERLEVFGLTKRRILLDCLNLLRHVTRGDERRLIKLIPSNYVENILKLYSQNDEESFEGLVRGIIESKVIFQFICSIVIRLVVSNVFDKHINLGDTFDRGESADKLIKLYKAYFGNENKDTPMHYIWGNHDVLWLGAGIGNPILCLEALRISVRYNNLDFLNRYGFKLDKLKKLAQSTYHLLPDGDYIKNKDFPADEAELACKMTKTLLVLQMKATYLGLKGFVGRAGEIDYAEECERHFKLLAMLPKGIKEDRAVWAEYYKLNPLIRDCFFPTIDDLDPAKFTDEETEVLQDIIQQFTSLRKLQDDLSWMFEFGETYLVVDNTLYYHAAIPVKEDGTLQGFGSNTGKKLLDYVHVEIKRIAKKHGQKEAITNDESMMFWYLWCGKLSPFFAKSKMATLERAVFVKELAEADPLTTHAELSNPFFKQIRNNDFLNHLLKEFHAEKICMGHTPIKTLKQAILSDSIHAFIVDGGASAAYGDRGAVLVYTPQYSYMIFHPCLEDLISAEKENRLPEIQVQKLEERGKRRLKDMQKGYFLEKELEAIDHILGEKLPQFESSYFC